MNFRNISSWCIRNPVPPIVLFVGLLLAGLLAFMRLDVNNFPDVEFPAVQVNISQPGAAPSEMESQITQRVEAAIRSVENVEEINSSLREGFSQTMVSFHIGTPLDRATEDVRTAIAQIRGDLPEGILEPQVERMQTNDGGEISFIAAETNDMTLEQLSWYIDNEVSRRLLSIEGVGAVTREGGVDRQIRITLDPVALQAQGITAAQVNQQLRQVNLNASGGRAELAGSEQTVRIIGNATDAYNLGQTQISVPGGRVVRLSDLGKVSDSTDELRSEAILNGKPVVSFNIKRARGYSDLTVYDGAWDELRKIEKENPRVQFVEVANTVNYTENQYDSSMIALIEGAVLAVLVVFLFLRDFRATIISAVAIPLSAIPAFWFMSLIGINLNFLSLLALALVAGVLVDDAIVEIENIVRHMRMGKSGYQAAIDAADEIGLAVLATTSAIIAVFLPVALMPGISGQFFYHFGFTVVLSVAMSLLVARMITPLMAAYFLRAHGVEEHASGKWMTRYLSLLNWTLDDSETRAVRAAVPAEKTRVHFVGIEIVLQVLNLIAAIAAAIAAMKALTALGLPALAVNLLAIVALVAAAIIVHRLMSAALSSRDGGFARWHTRLNAQYRDHRVKMLGVGFIALLMTVALFATLPMQFQPETDEPVSTVRIEMPPGTTLAQTRGVASEASGILLAHPNVDRVFQRVFTSVGYIQVMFKKDRTQKSPEIERELNPKLATIADARVNFVSQNNAGGRPIGLFLGSSNPVLLQQTSAKLAQEMETIPELVAPRVQGDNERPEIQITPRFDLAADLGVTTTALSQTIRIATIGDIEQNSAKFSLADRQVPIIVSLPISARRDLSVLENLPVPTQSGASVPLKAVAEISFGSGPSRVQRTNQVRRTVIGADLAQGVVSSDAWKKIRELPTYKNLPDGVQELTLGDQKWQGELLVSFGIALASGVLLVFAVLVLLYRRFLAPFVNMGSLVLAPLGAAIALHIAGTPVSLPVFIGILMLFGIVAKNSILLIDFAVEMMNHGMAKDEAIYEAGHKRAQPIVMTTVAMVAGMLPIALSLHGDGSWRAPMGITVIGGLILSTALTLLLVPAYFSIAIDIEQAISKVFHRLVTEEAQRPGEAVPAE
ncbi:efflux RND transporter permease subunit [Sphingomonas sabuli]|uniref:Efflux RND transporter permease subunit n=1 Tax=Sphingomonas sabuli TaxID=2764186 RepID=A0A7G9KZZ5_9SPHN|nr:efflux RND transporter permease subunit [Sphingomonas sabuli]QNM81944.1 efflux RND transporter permease subunit [Sphingomonas sabuli]